MRRTGRLTATAGALCALLLVTGCSAVMTGGQAVPMAAGSAAARSSGSWFGMRSDVALYLQWTRVGPNVTGSIKAALADAGTVKTAERAFVGVIDGTSVLLSLTAVSPSAATSVAGSFDGSVLRLDWPSNSGEIVAVQLRSGTIDDYNRALSAATPTTAPRGQTFDAMKVAAGVRKILTDSPPAGYGATGVGQVTCPQGEPVVAGTTFICTVLINGASKSVTVTVKDSAGTYEVGVPS